MFCFAKHIPISPHLDLAGAVDNVAEMAARTVEINAWTLVRSRLYYLITMGFGP